jgi:hypothetical protein
MSRKFPSQCHYKCLGPLCVYDITGWVYVLEDSLKIYSVHIFKISFPGSDNCPTFCPTTCNFGEFACSGGVDADGCKKKDFCVRMKVIIVLIITLKLLPI